MLMKGNRDFTRTNSSKGKNLKIALSSLLVTGVLLSVQGSMLPLGAISETAEKSTETAVTAVSTAEKQNEEASSQEQKADLAPEAEVGSLASTETEADNTESKAEEDPLLVENKEENRVVSDEPSTPSKPASAEEKAVAASTNEIKSNAAAVTLAGSAEETSLEFSPTNEPVGQAAPQEQPVIRFHANGGEFVDGTTVQTQKINEHYGYDYASFGPMYSRLKTINGRVYRPAPGYEVEAESGLARYGFAFKGWSTEPNGTVDVTQTMWDQPIRETTDFYAIWIPLYVNKFHANGGTWYYSPDSNAGDENPVPVVSSLFPEGAVQTSFKDQLDASQDNAHSRGFFRLAAPNRYMKFKGWYTSADQISTAHNFNAPITEPRDAYAHWTAGLRIDVLGADDRNIDDYAVEVINSRDQSILAGDFTGSATGKPNDQWQSESQDIYMGDEFTIKFTELPTGKKLDIISIPTLDQIAWVKPVAGEANTFTVSMRKMPHKHAQEAYYARFRLVPATYEVNFVAHEHGTVAAQEALTVEHNQKITQIPEVSAELGYQFAGWQKDDQAGKLYTSAEVQNLEITADTTFTAVFDKDMCQLYFDAKGGAFTGGETEKILDVQVGQTIEIIAAPTREGFEFQYWKGSRYNPGDEYQVIGAHRFEAVWKPVSSTPTTTTTSTTTTAPTTTKAKPAQALARTGQASTAAVVAVLSLATGALLLIKKRRTELN